MIMSLLVKIKDNKFLAFVYLVLGVIITFSIFYEQMPDYLMLNPPFDGANYAQWTKNFDEMFFGKQISQYHIQRVFIAFIAWSFAQLTNLSITNSYIIHFFIVFNIICILISVIYLNLILNFFNIKQNIKAFAVILTFFNFALLKYPFYYPVLNDTAALAIAFPMSYYYLKNKIGAFILCTLIGCFTFPSFIYIAIILLFFPYNSVQNFPQYQNNKILLKLGTVALILSLIVFQVYFFVYKGIRFEEINNGWLSNFYIATYIPAFLVVIFYFSYIILTYSINDNFLLSSKNEIKLKNVFIAILLFISLKILINIFAGKETGMTIMTHIKILNLSILSQPFKFFVSHSIYYGLLIMLIPFYFIAFRNKIVSLGYGYFFVILFFLLYSVNSESRQFINFIPFLILPIALVFNEYNINSKALLIFLFINIVISRFWYYINITTPIENNLTEFPLQRYFMFQGPWMGDCGFMINVLIVICCILFLFLLRTRLISKQ